MYDLWNKISFMVQLISACLIFMIPLRKKKFFTARICLLSAVCILVFYYINTIYEEGAFTVLNFFYWGFYLAVSIVFVRMAVEGSMLQAVYCTVCAYAVQHVAIDIFRIMEEGFRLNIIVSTLVYIGIHIAAYYIFAKKLSENGKYLVSKADFFPMFTIILLVWIFGVIERSDLPDLKPVYGIEYYTI